MVLVRDVFVKRKLFSCKTFDIVDWNDGKGMFLGLVIGAKILLP